MLWEAIQQNTTEIASAFVALVTLASAIVYGLKKNGLLTIGKAPERRKEPPCKGYCGEHSTLSQNVAILIHDVDGIKASAKETKRFNEAIAKDLNQLIGTVNSIHKSVNGKQ